MGKRIISQNRGKGSPKFKAAKHKHRLTEYGPWCLEAYCVSDIQKDKYRIIAKLSCADGQTRHIMAARGINTRESYNATPKIGQVMLLGGIPLKSQICAFQNRIGGSSAYKRAPGARATIIGHQRNEKTREIMSVLVRYGVGAKIHKLPPKCYALIGVIAGGDMGIKPFLKAGLAWHDHSMRHKRWPIVRAVAMNIFDHCFGGSGKKRPGRPKTSSRRGPPGTKVGSIAASQTGYHH